MNIHPYLLMSQQTQDGGPGLMANVVLFGSIIAIFYFMIIRPQQKRQKQHQAMLEALKKGDKVVVSGGIHGVVAGFDEKTVLVQIADNVKIKVERASVTGVVNAEEPEKK